MGPNQMLEALIFDFDGVLADTEVLHWKSWAQLLLPHGLRLSWEEYCVIGRGVSDLQFYEVIRQRIPSLDVAYLEQQDNDRKRKVCESALLELPIPQDTIQLLKSLEARRLGLVTSSERREVEPVLRAAGIRDLFEAAVFGADVVAHKPDPEPYLRIAQLLGIRTGVAFEDSEAGICSANAAGFKVVRIQQPRELAEAVARYLREEAVAGTG
jgi:beta-phosphoglucomutase